jgi:Flp pilus assembly protein TadG
MQENNPRPLGGIKTSARRQRGGAAVEFAILAIVFFTLVFGVLELARVMYLFNILQEVTRRAAVMAANSGFDQNTLDKIRSQALFADRDGNLMFGAPVTPAHLKIDYLSISRDTDTGAVTAQPASPMPSCPARNHLNCLANPYDSSCIRLVRVRVCQPGGGADTCTSVPYQMLFGFVDLSALKLPRSETIVPAQTLGYTFGSMPCP